MNRIIVALFCIAILGLSVSAQETEKKPYFCKDSIEVIDVEPFTYVAYEFTGSYSQQSHAYTDLWEESVKQFLDWDHSFFTVYYNSPETTAEKDLKWEVGTKLKEDEDIQKPLCKKEWGHKTVVKIIYDGPLAEEVGTAYGAANEWISKNGYQITGPSCQKNLNRPRPNKEGVLVGKMEIWLPVKKI